MQARRRQVVLPWLVGQLALLHHIIHLHQLAVLLDLFCASIIQVRTAAHFGFHMHFSPDGHTGAFNPHPSQALASLF